MSADAMSQVWYQVADLTPAQAVVLLAVADVVNDVHDNEFWMTSKALGRKAGMSPACIRHRLSELVDLGWLSVTEVLPGSPTRYQWVCRESTGVRPQSTGVCQESTPPSSLYNSRNSTNGNGNGSKPKRATRIPDPFTVGEDLIEWAHREIPGFNWQRESSKFLDHYRAANDKVGLKKDWAAAWRNWMRNNAEGKFAR